MTRFPIGSFARLPDGRFERVERVGGSVPGPVYFADGSQEFIANLSGPYSPDAAPFEVGVSVEAPGYGVLRIAAINEDGNAVALRRGERFIPTLALGFRPVIKIETDRLHQRPRFPSSAFARLADNSRYANTGAGQHGCREHAKSCA